MVPHRPTHHTSRAFRPFLRAGLAQAPQPSRHHHRTQAPAEGRGLGALSGTQAVFTDTHSTLEIRWKQNTPHSRHGSQLRLPLADFGWDSLMMRPGQGERTEATVFLTKTDRRRGRGHGSVVELYPSTCKALGSTPSTAEHKKLA